ncbi:MAG TPA: ribose 5-phosphate isomerase B [Bacillota bacterium]|nr:ribose 5-phosphate isomerase B [Bacillota bacterium]
MIAIGCDHGGFEIKQKIVQMLREKNISFIDCGTDSTQSVDYPIYAKKVCALIQKKDADKGILVCGTGIGMSIAANKQQGIRAAVVTSDFTAEMARRHNDANVICLGGPVLSDEDALRFTDIFLNTPFDGGRHSTRVWMYEH